MLYCFYLHYLIALCLLRMHFKISAYNDHLVLLFSRNTCSYGSRASQFIKLECDWVLATVPNLHVKSRVYFKGFVTEGEIVRLNLFNYVLVLFCAKFACNLAIRYPVFRWELCKGNVWESVKKAQEVCTQEEPRDWISRLTSRQNGTCVKHAGGAEASRQL